MAVVVSMMLVGHLAAVGSARAEYGAMTQPTSGFVTSRVDQRCHSGADTHDGIDIANDTGTPVRAAYPGRVVRRSNPGGYGRYIDLVHVSGYVTRYAHLSAYRVPDDVHVDQGARIGDMGSTGNSSGPHLHFEVLRNGVRMNLNDAYSCHTTVTASEPIPLGFADLPVVVPETSCRGEPAATHEFSDVPARHPFCAEIAWMSAQGISTGFEDGTFRPSDGVTRMAMSAFMVRLAGAEPASCAEPPYSDVPVRHPFCAEIAWMSAQGISTGFEDGTFRPSDGVTRMAMSAFMARLADADPGDCTVRPFSDVPVSHAYCPQITWMSDEGISTGFGDGTFQPGAGVTRMAMSAFMERLAAPA